MSHDRRHLLSSLCLTLALTAGVTVGCKLAPASPEDSGADEEGG